MKVFSLATGADTAGIGIGIKRAFDRHGRDIAVRTMVASQNYIGYPVDIPWAKLRLQQEWDQADVVQIHNSLHAHEWYDVTGKPTVLMHHGIGWSERTYHDIVEEARKLGVVQIGSTIDLSVHEPLVQWCGPPVDIEAMQRLREKYGALAKRRPIRVAHAPTNAEIKGTSKFLAVMEVLAAKYPVEAVLIQGMTNRQCLALKATCDILFDQPVLGYGVNAIEAWAMGIPVIVGVADPRVRERMVETWGGLPFVECNDTEDGIGSAIERLLIDPFYNSEMAATGFRHVNRWHSQRAVVERLSAIYRAAGATEVGPGTRRLTPHQIRKVSRLSPDMQLRA